MDTQDDSRSPKILSMDDWVRVEDGSIGKIVLISEYSAIVSFGEMHTNKEEHFFLLNELTRVDPPQ
jgi:hypothetical protein